MSRGEWSVLRNWTTGDSVGRRDDGNELIINPDPGAGVVPDDPSATTLV